MCVCVSVSLCLSGGHETADKTPMKDKKHKTRSQPKQEKKKKTWSILSKSIWSVSVSHSLKDHETKQARSLCQTKQI
jgi:hypothetical protein